MKFKPIVIAGFMCLAEFNATAAGDWKTEIENDINSGNLTLAERKLSSLPAQLYASYRYDVDSLSAIVKRVRYDFSLTPADGVKQIMERKNDVTTIDIASWIDRKYIEVMTIDGREMWFRKAVRNLWLLNPDLPKPDKTESAAKLRTTIAEAKAGKVDKSHCSNWHHAKIKFALDVDADAVPAGEEIKVWLPVPLTSQRQKNVKITSANREYTLSADSEHNTAYLTANAEAGKSTHFEVELQYDVAAQFFERDYLLANVKKYDTSTDFYKKYTSSDNRHIMVNEKMKSLALSIVGSEENPVLQASKIYNWIVGRYPWAGARDYGTIINIPEYVLQNKHGDCGQVALLYISLVRSIGIPAKWESGWMLHPGEVNWHDWAETYFEGVGWVPTDVSFGRNDDDVIRNYYKTGIDVYRFASNSDYGKNLSPRKKFLRSEPIDFQAGEVEWNGGNIEATSFHSKLTIIEFSKLNK